jgi:predicted DNA binding CopG/RHH family protein
MKKKIKGPKFNKDGYEEDFEGVNIDDLVPVDRDKVLPPIEVIAASLKNARVTIVLDNQTVAFFKKEAEKHGVPYQKMVRQVLRHYMEQCKKAA